jgi:hypothetical protein
MQGDGRFKTSLTNAAWHARKHGYMPCTASVGYIKKMFTGQCHNPACAAKDGENGYRLGLDHDHGSTGAALGWLCHSCNLAIGKAKNNAKLLLGLIDYALQPKPKVKHSDDVLKELLKRFRHVLLVMGRTSKKQNYKTCTATPEEITEVFTGYCHNIACGVAEDDCKTRLHVEHSHATGELRGTLCSDCNLIFGLQRDSVERVRGLVSYLEVAKQRIAEQASPT